jgi:Ca-activated chloride channel family protein
MENLFEIENLFILVITLWTLLPLNWFFKYTKNKKKHIDKIVYLKKISNFSYNWIAWIISYIFLLFSVSISIFMFMIAYFENNKNNNENKIPSKTNIMFVLDVSKSMNTIDVKYNRKITTRLNLAKQAIKNYVLKHPNYKYWLVIFAWQAQTILPLTNDKNIFLDFLEWVDYRNLTKQWTNFSQAIKFAIDRFKPYKWNKYLVIISDWWDPWDYKWIDLSFPKDIQAFVFGIWSKIWWKIFLWTDDFWEPIFQRYRWNYVITKLNESNLKKLANDINWKYFYLDSPGKLNILEKYIKDDALKNLKIKSENNIFTIYNIAAIVSLIMFLISLAIKILYEQKNNLEIIQIKWKKLA